MFKCWTFNIKFSPQLLPINPKQPKLLIMLACSSLTHILLAFAILARSANATLAFTSYAYQLILMLLSCYESWLNRLAILIYSEIHKGHTFKTC